MRYQHSPVRFLWFSWHLYSLTKPSLETTCRKHSRNVDLLSIHVNQEGVETQTNVPHKLLGAYTVETIARQSSHSLPPSRVTSFNSSEVKTLNHLHKLWEVRTFDTTADLLVCAEIESPLGFGQSRVIILAKYLLKILETTNTCLHHCNTDIWCISHCVYVWTFDIQCIAILQHLRYNVTQWLRYTCHRHMYKLGNN